MTAMTDPILAALHEQVDCYRRLAKLAELQHDHVQLGRTEQLLEVLGARQEVLEQVAGHEAILAPAKQRWPQYLGGLCAAARAQDLVTLRAGPLENFAGQLGFLGTQPFDRDHAFVDWCSTS